MPAGYSNTYAHPMNTHKKKNNQYYLVSTRKIIIFEHKPMFLENPDVAKKTPNEQRDSKEFLYSAIATTIKL